MGFSLSRGDEVKHASAEVEEKDQTIFRIYCECLYKPGPIKQRRLRLKAIRPLKIIRFDIIKEPHIRIKGQHVGPIKARLARRRLSSPSS